MSTVKFKRSSVFGKAPLPSQIEIGEICLNFNSSNPFLSIKDSENEIQKFLSENKVRNLIADVKNDVDASFYTKAQINQMFEDLESGGTIAFDDYYTKIESDAKYQALSGMSSYLTVASAESTYQPIGDYALVSQLPDLTDYALKSEIPDTSNLAEKSEIPDVSDFVTSAFTEATYAKKGDTPTDVYTKTETDQLLAGKANSAHTHDYETLTNKPDLSNFATKGEIPDTSSFITSGFCEDHYQPKGTYVVPSDLNDYALKSEVPDSYTKTETDNLLAAKSNSAHTHTSSDVTDLNSVLAGYSTSSHTHPEYVTSGDVETMISGKTNIWAGTLAQYQTLEDKDDNTIYCITDSNYQYLTLEQAEELFQSTSGMSAYALSSHTHSYNDLTDKPDLSGYLTASDIEGKADKSELNDYLKVSAATNTYATKDELAAKANSGHSHTSSDITDLSTVLAGYASSSHTHSYNDLTDKPDLSGYLTEHQDISGKADKTDLANYQPVSGMSAYSQTGHTHSYNDLEDKPTIPSLEGLATKAELENYQPVSGMTDYQPVSGMSAYSQTGHTHSEYSQTGHTHTSGDVTDLSTVLAGYSQTGHTHSEYSPTGHTHSEYLTQTSADSRYARVISISQSDYDTLVSNDQVQQGVLYCIIEDSQSSSGDSGGSGSDPVTPDPVIPDPDDGGNDF